MPRTAPPFWERVDRASECWEWTAARDRHGAGVVWWEGKTDEPPAHLTDWKRQDWIAGVERRLAADGDPPAE